MIIYSLIKEGKSFADICSELNFSKQKLNYYITQLKNNGLISKIGYGTWEVKKEVKTFSLGSRVDKPVTNLHALQINFPIIAGKIIDDDWQVKEKLMHWIPKYKHLDTLGGLTIKNNNNKSLTVFVKSRDILSLDEIDNLAIKVRVYITEYFKIQGVSLDFFNAEVKNLNIATEDKDSEGMNRKGEKFELDLNKKAEKIFDNDKIDGKAWIDGSPFGFTAETNDKEWKRWYLGMPFMVRDLFGLMGNLTNNITHINEKIDYVAENYASHVKMVEEGSKVFKKLNDRLSQKSLRSFL